MSSEMTDEQARKRNEFANALFVVDKLAKSDLVSTLKDFTDRKIPENGEERSTWFSAILNKSH